MAINSLSAASYGFSGLASGLDTESMVEQMLTGTKNRIDSTNQKITQLEYKQELYREITSELQAFQKTYFDILSSSSLRSQSFFNDMSASSLSSAYTVSASSSALSGNVTIDRIVSLATKYKQTAIKAASGQLTGNIKAEGASDAVQAWRDKIADAENENITINVGGTEVKIAVSELAGKSNSQMEAVIQKALDDKSVDASAKFINGQFTITANGAADTAADTAEGAEGAEDEGIAITVTGAGLGNNMLSSSDISGSNSVSFGIISSAGLPSIKVNVDGVEKEIFFNPDGDKSIGEQLNSALYDAFGSGVSVSQDANGVLTFSSDTSRKVTIGGDEESLKMLGLKSGASNKLSLSTSLSGNGFATAIEGDVQRFSINGVEFAFSSDATLSSVINTINNSEAGVTISYSSSSDRFSIESKSTGERTYGFDLQQTEGNLLTAMFGIPESGSLDATTDFNGQALASVDGSAVSTASTLASLGMDQGVTFEFGGTSVEVGADETVEQMIAKVNTALAQAGSHSTIEFVETAASPYIRICGVDIPMGIVDMSGRLTGATEATVQSSTSQYFEVTAGTNAVMSINGVTVERSTNDFTVDGLSFSLKGTTDVASTVTVNRDVDKIYDTIVKFVEDYNKLINKMNGLLDADATYREYPPLTTEQEDEMTEQEIEKWNEKAKEGLLRHDDTLSSVVSSLRSTLYTKPEGAFALYDLGITTSYFGTKDNLTIADHDKLKAMIAESPDKVMKLFTDKTDGLANKLNTAIDRAAKASFGSPGSLVRMAGSTGMVDRSSSIYKQIKELKDQLGTLENRYENERDRYWKQFNAMEQMIAQMNSTSSWLGSMMGG